MRRLLEILAVFTRLGLSSFGGPGAHIGYFRREFVARRGWLDDAGFAQLLALCQLLPGPASSQLGFVIGLARGGWPGALAAFIGFTAPSALLMLGLALGLDAFDTLSATAVFAGLKMVALAVVAQALWAMLGSLCPDAARRIIAALASLVALALAAPLVQPAVVALGAALGILLLREIAPPSAQGAGPGGLSRRQGLWLLGLAVLLGALLPALAWRWGGNWALVDAFYRAGALVFGGGHVVLPMLEAASVGTGHVGPDAFLAGYGAAQALPGPLFSFAAFVGARWSGGWAGGLLAIGAIFLPGLMLVAGMLALWRDLLGHPRAAQALAGANAAVVGLLGAAWIDPLWPAAVHGPIDLLISIAAIAAMLSARVPVLLVVLGCVAASLLQAASLASG